ncbi:MAG: hypothetical protein AAF941_08535 [Pseudomonadota bacterium]
MTRLSSTVAAASILALSACGSEAPNQSENSAEDFAARINSGAKGAISPTTANPRSDAVSGPFVAGTYTDPNTACGAARLATYVGREADSATRDEIMQIVADPSKVRFILPRGRIVEPDPDSSLLNLVTDDTGVIRDVRCG